MSDSPEMRTDAPTIPNEVYLLIVVPGEADPDGPPNMMNVQAVATAYDLNKGPLNGARQLGADETSNSFDDFVGEVFGDMMELTSNTIYGYAESVKAQQNTTEDDLRTEDVREADRKRTRAELYLKLLLDMGDKPAELMGNMLATFLVSSIEDTLESPDYDERVAEWRASMSGDPAAKE